MPRERSGRFSLESTSAVWWPRVLLIEATFPNSQIPSHRQWEDLVLKEGYLFASFDGINRLDAAEEQSSLIDRLAPANVLDRFVPAHVQLINDELERVRSVYLRLEHEVLLKDSQIEAAAEYACHLESRAWNKTWNKSGRSVVGDPGPV